jgi:hypothetical protein
MDRQVGPEKVQQLKLRYELAARQRVLTLNHLHYYLSEFCAE